MMKCYFAPTVAAEETEATPPAEDESPPAADEPGKGCCWHMYNSP